MGRGATKAAGNVYYQARIEAAKWNGSLSSREGAAEALGVSVDTVKNIELGLHKCVPVDLVVLMADLYNAPYLLGAYCKNECPIGCNYPIATMMTPVERTTLKLINLLDPGKLEDVKRELISIAEDGEITEDEIPSLQEILEYADKLILAATELKMLGSQVMTDRDRDHQANLQLQSWRLIDSKNAAPRL